MNEPTIDAEVVNQSQAIAIRPQMAVAQPMSVQDILGQVRLIQEVMRSVMSEGEHYGKVPGCGDKSTLLQPGAQKLTMTFRLAPEYVIQETNFPKDHKEYRVVCTLKSIQSGNFVGQGVGCCSTLESKYRYRGGSRKCPKCGKETIIKGKAEYGGGWICFAKKGGCNAKWPDGATEIESQSVEKMEHENPADFYNTVLKMAKKRAFVDATITATAASDIFTQDLGEDEEPATPPPQQPQQPQQTKPPGRTIPKRDAPIASEKTRQWMIEKLAGLEEQAWNFFVSKGMLTDGETLNKLPLEFVPTSTAALMELRKILEGMKAVQNRPTPESDEPPGLSEPEGMQEPAEDDWRNFPLPFTGRAGKPDEVPKGTPLEKLDKKYLFGLVMNVKVETEYNGKPLSPEKLAADKAFRAALDEAGRKYGWLK